MKTEQGFIYWLFNNYFKTDSDLFYHKRDWDNIKRHYSLNELRETFFQKCKLIGDCDNMCLTHCYNKTVLKEELDINNYFKPCGA